MAEEAVIEERIVLAGEVRLERNLVRSKNLWLERIGSAGEAVTGESRFGRGSNDRRENQLGKNGCERIG